MFVYSLMPIDCWDGWQLATDYSGTDERPGLPKEFWNRLVDAFRGATLLGWEGDIREGPFISGIPGQNDRINFMIAWKQDNKGTTFVASPFRLQWLEGQSDWTESKFGLIRASAA